MAKLSRDDVLKLAQLAKIKLSSSEIETFREELSSILDYVDQLKSVDVSNLKPTNQVTGLVNVWREDKLIDYGYTADDLLANVPAVTDRLIKVKRVLK